VKKKKDWFVEKKALLKSCSSSWLTIFMGWCWKS